MEAAFKKTKLYFKSFQVILKKKIRSENTKLPNASMI